MYISSKVMLSEGQWHRGMVVNHENAEKLTAYLIHWRNSIEEIELDSLLKGRPMSLCQLKLAYRTGCHSGACLRDFTSTVVENSDRKKSTKQGYLYLMNEIEKWYGKLSLEDITYDWVLRWKARMKQSGVSDNTIKGRMKLMRCICNEALKRNVLADDPFKFVKIGHMTPKEVWLDMKEIRRIERVVLDGRMAIVRDLFMLGCWTGLRWSDLTTLELSHIKDGILRKRMCKTNHDVVIPIGTLFWGKGMEIIDRYRSNLARLTGVCCNTTANRIIKEVARKAGLNKNVSFHWARKSCSSNLLLLGMTRNEISQVLGHADVSVTDTHYIFSKEHAAIEQSKRIFSRRKAAGKSKNGLKSPSDEAGPDTLEKADDEPCETGFQPSS